MIVIRVEAVRAHGELDHRQPADFDAAGGVKPFEHGRGVGGAEIVAQP
jgi:hypothetical protein